MNTWKKIILLPLTFIATQVHAGGFLLWEQNGAGVGDYHAGAAVDASDASTQYYNPAGLTYLHNMQAVASLTVIPTDIEYSGTVQVSTVNPSPLAPEVVANVPAGGVNFIPSLYFSQPLSPLWSWGFEVSVPYGLKTDYNKDSFIRYAATETSLQTLDIGPSVGYQVTKALSVGGGIDAVYADAKFDQYAGGVDPSQDTLSDNKLNSWAPGYHLGVMYQFTPATRLGLAYHSKVVEHMGGRSQFSGYFANGNGNVGNLSGGTQTSNNLKATLTLPPNTTLSALHELNEQWTLLGSITYTQWSYIKSLLLQGIASCDTSTLAAINNAEVYIQQDFRNTWNVALGAQYKVSPMVTLETGIGYDQTPVRSATYRYVQTPDANRYALAVGGQFKPNKKFVADIGWTHLFIQKAPINSSQTVGTNPNNPNPNGETVTTQGEVISSADVFGFQLAWNID